MPVGGMPAGGGSDLHDALHEGLAHEVLVLSLEQLGDAQGVGHLEDLGLVVVHAGLNDLLDGVIDELAEAALAGTSASVLGGPLAGGGVEEVVSPQLLHHLVLLHAKLLGVHLGEGGRGEGPAVEPGAEGHCSLLWVHLHACKTALPVSTRIRSMAWVCAWQVSGWQPF